MPRERMTDLDPLIVGTQALLYRRCAIPPRANHTCSIIPCIYSRFVERFMPIEEELYSEDTRAQ